MEDSDDIAVFFDLDGTLADTRADLAATVNHTRRDFSLEPLPMELIISYVGQGARRLLERSIPEISGEGERLLSIFLEHYDEHALEHVTLYPGVTETLLRLQTHGVKLGVNTAKPRSATRLILDHLDLRRFFGNAVIAGGDSTEMKPSALPLLDCAKLLGHRPGPRDLMVGDNWTDLACAVNAGVRSVFCNFGFGVRKDLTPTYTIDAFPQLIELIIRNE